MNKVLSLLVVAALIAVHLANADVIIEDDGDKLFDELVRDAKLKRSRVYTAEARQEAREILERILRSRLLAEYGLDSGADDRVYKRQQNWINFGDGHIARARENKKIVFDTDVGR